MTPEPLLAAAILDEIRRRSTIRVPMPELLRAAAAVDMTAAASVGWRGRVLAAINDLVAAGHVEVPKTSFDRTAHPPLPAYVRKPAEPSVPRRKTHRPVWHEELSWAAKLWDDKALTATDQRHLTAVNTWLSRRQGTAVPMRERSLDIFDDEKTLDTVVLGPLFAPGRLTWQLLEAFPCWPPVEQTVLGDGDWLIVENFTTYHSITGRAREAGFRGRIVWGSGNQVATRLSALADSPAPQRLWYFGDIDAGGFRVARSAARRADLLGLPPLRPARGLYRMAFERGKPRGDKANRPNGEALAWIRSWLGEQLGSDIAELVGQRNRIVQEYVGKVVLSNSIVADWFGR
ncbi:Wadjet anti-phage system protein JetD domain-containing protein [Nocardia terpenica]|nr:Wadjet anti-phage system protein JetD domain-containing protein [Nocardia terpenica]